MYSFDLVYDSGGSNHLYDPTKARRHAVTAFAVRIVPLIDQQSGQSPAEAYANTACTYTQRQTKLGADGNPSTEDSESTFAIDGPGMFPFAGQAPIDTSPMIEPELTGGVDGYTYRVWVAEAAWERIEIDLSQYTGFTPSGTGTINSTFENDLIPAGDPSQDPTFGSGAVIVGASSVRVLVDVSKGTFTGGGSFLFWVEDQEGQWFRSPQLDQLVPDEAAGLTRFSYADLGVGVKGKRVAIRPSGVNVEDVDALINVIYEVQT